MSGIEVAVAAPHERVAISNLMQLYIHDFSEQWADLDRPEGEVDETGRFSDYPLDPYWSQADHVPLLIRDGGRLAGFALLNTDSHTGADLDRNMAEFFILRKHRRAGVGAAAARAIFSRYPGRWEAAIARRNVGALPFWRSVVTSHPQVAEVQEIDVDDEAWNGPVLRFRIGG